MAGSCSAGAAAALGASAGTVPLAAEAFCSRTTAACAAWKAAAIAVVGSSCAGRAGRAGRAGSWEAAAAGTSGAPSAGASALTPPSAARTDGSSPAAGSALAPSSAWRMESPRRRRSASMRRMRTVTSWPSRRTALGSCWPAGSSERWISPSTPSSMRAKAPNGAILVMVPCTSWPTW